MTRALHPLHAPIGVSRPQQREPVVFCDEPSCGGQIFGWPVRKCAQCAKPFHRLVTVNSDARRLDPEAVPA